MVDGDLVNKSKIMEKIYVVPCAGHLGYQKTLKELQQNFHWPDLTIEVRDYIL